MRLVVVAAVHRLVRGNLAAQPFWEWVNQVSLRGMNIGMGGEMADSGELRILDMLAAGAPRVEKIVVFDVGANVGDYSIAAAQRLGQRAMVYSFEPSPETFAQLDSRASKLATVATFAVGLGDTAEQRTLFEVPGQSGLASVYRRELGHHQLEALAGATISLITLDEFCATHAISHIDLLKIDVEGHELNVLGGASGMLSVGAIEMIQFEFGGCNIDSRTYLSDFFHLLGDQFVINRVVKDGLFPLPEYQERYEVFTTTNFLAMRRGN
jgi:FkbM family methyltransferase